MQWQTRIASISICSLGLLPYALAESAAPSTIATTNDLNRIVIEHVVSSVAPKIVGGHIESPAGLFTRLEGGVVSPDGMRVAYIDYVSKGTSNITVLLDGKKNRYYPYASEAEASEAEGFDPPITAWTFSPDSKRFAYVERQEQNSVVLDGKVGLKHDGIDLASLRFSPDSNHIGYIADGTTVIDSKPGRRYELISDLVFSPDGKRVGYVASNKSGRPSFQATFAVVDGKEGKIYDEVRNFAFSPDSKRVAYVVTNRGPTFAGKDAFVVLDGVESKHYFGIGDTLRFSPDSQSLLYVAQFAERRWSVVVNGKEGNVHDAWAIRNPVFSPNGQRVAYVVAVDYANDKRTRYVVSDGKEGKHYSGDISLDAVNFSPDSKHIAYSVGIGGYEGEGFVAVDDKEGKHYVGNRRLITWSPDSSQLAYVVSKKGKHFVVFNGKEGKQYDFIDGLSFSPDGKYLAYAAYNRKTNKWVVVINEQEGKAYDYIYSKSVWDEDASVIAGGSPVFRSQSLRFDTAGQLRYLAVNSKKILLVEENIGL